MTRTFRLFAMVLSISLLDSCSFKGWSPKNPCAQEQFLSDIENYSKAELHKLARILEASTYGSQKANGCRAALLAKVYLAEERMSKASDYFSIAAKKLPELSEYFLLAKANAELKQKNFKQGKKIADALLSSRTAALSPQFALRVQKVLADIAVQQKDNQQIIKTHQDLLARGYSENEVLLFNLATALTNVNEHQKANEVYKRLLINFPVSPGARRAEQLQNLAQYNLNLKETEKRFDKLIEKLAFDQAVNDADFLLKNPMFSLDDNARGQIQTMAVKSLLMNNQFEAGIKRGQKMVNKPKASTKELEGYAWALAKVGHFIEASDYYGKSFKKATEREDQARTCFFKGFSLYEASLYSMALFAWQTCHASVSNTPYYENYLWYQTLATILNGNYHKASGLLSDLVKRFKTSPDSEKYAYFYGYTLNQINKKREGSAVLQELSSKTSPSYYVLLARHSLRKASVKGDDIPSDALVKLAQETKDPDCRNALILYHLGFRDDARDLILKSPSPANDKLALLQHLGFYHDAWQRSAGKKATIANGKLTANANIRSSFPRPHKSIVDEISKKYDVNRSLLYAIIREESGFLEHAISSRGALGLMQMMPFVAEDLASRLSISKFDQEHLKDPKISIELGALFVAILKRQFNNPHLVVAAYNAGPHQVQKWLNNFGHLPTELFIERIPFKQTRDYIKKVLPSESLYHAMNGQELRLLL